MSEIQDANDALALAGIPMRLTPMAEMYGELRAHYDDLQERYEKLVTAADLLEDAADSLVQWVTDACQEMPEDPTQWLELVGQLDNALTDYARAGL